MAVAAFPWDLPDQCTADAKGLPSAPHTLATAELAQLLKGPTTNGLVP